MSSEIQRKHLINNLDIPSHREHLDIDGPPPDEPEQVCVHHGEPHQQQRPRLAGEEQVRQWQRWAVQLICIVVTTVLTALMNI